MREAVTPGKIPVSGPWVTQHEIDLVAEAVAHAWYESANVYHARFEEAFARYLGVRHAVALPSCTSALHLALLALGVGPGDEVVVPEITWIATAAPISYVGATPVFADIDRDTWCLSPESLEKCVTERTRAVIPVDLYGGMAAMSGIREIARRHRIAIIEDAAQAIGAESRGRRAGSFGDVGVFSFHGSKTLTTGEGGMLVTDRPEIVERVHFYRDHGRKPGGPMFYNSEVAYKYKMSSLQAALGLAQLDRVEELVARKRQIFSWYQQALADAGDVVLNSEPPGTRNACWMVTAILPDAPRLRKEAVISALGDAGIDSRPFFYPLSSLPAYAALPSAAEAPARNPIAYAISPRGINLPSAMNLTRDQVDFVAETLQRLLRQASN